ncbi:MAG: SDR family NAD(P)-dependent oxidoreductase [Pseudomonadota bacterium]
MRFSGKRVFVTGGARGIGAAIAKAFSEEGAQVAINARTTASIEACRESHGQDYIPVPGQIGSRAACATVVENAVAALGGLDVLVANAGIFAQVPFEEVSQEEFDANISVNLGGVFFCAQAAMPALRESKGSIVAVASDAALVSCITAPAYAAAKGGVTSLVRSLAVDYAADGVRVNSVCPGNVETDMIRSMIEQSADPQEAAREAAARCPMKRMAQAEEVAAAVLYLASDSAGFTTGVALPIDGGGVAGFD